MNSPTRKESDSIGTLDIPKNAYWGIHTARAVNNFQISGHNISSYPDIIFSLAHIKKAAAQANSDLKILSPKKSKAIVSACDLIISGKYISEFIVDVIQGGAGTSTNMNSNEVIANLAIEIMGHELGEYKYIHPLDDVNCCQSTNDVYPTAVKLALISLIKRSIKDINYLADECYKKGEELMDAIIIGRTQLQDAVPMSLGAQFKAWASILRQDLRLLEESSKELYEISMGGTAIGTGINSHPGYCNLVCKYLCGSTELQLTTVKDLIAGTQNTNCFVRVSSRFRELSISLSKMCNDLRLLSSGPQNGFMDIHLPSRASGSSIMPGKINPIIPEVVNQIAFAAIGQSMTVDLASEAGQLQLNAFIPIIALSLFRMCTNIGSGCYILAKQCVSGITVNRSLLQQRVAKSACLATALSPVIGYDKADRLAKMAIETNRPIKELALELGWISSNVLDVVLSEKNILAPSETHTKEAS